MSISFLRIVEDEWIEQSACTCCGFVTLCVSGWVSDHEHDVAQYFASWTDKRYHNVIFDIIYGPNGPNDPPSKRTAVSLSYSQGTWDSMFIDATSRPFAKRRAKYCVFPPFSSIPEELVIDSFRLVDFIISHDARLSGISRNDG